MFINCFHVFRKYRLRMVLIYFTMLSLLALLVIYCLPNLKFWRMAEINAPDFPTPFTATCAPKRDIFFLKTHKCASSTLQNVLLRYGYHHNLNFVLPTLGNYLGNQAPFIRGMTSMAPWHQLGYNIFCHHTVFNEQEVAAIMPNDTVYIAIVREPVSLFESLYSYAKLDLHFKQDLVTFALQAEPGVNVFTDRADGYLGVNQMAYDFGIRPREFGNATLVDRLIQRLDHRFDLILVAEHFDESMILLKEFLCWSLEDVTYFRHNARRLERKRNMTAEVVKQLERLNGVDVKLYRHFLRRFWTQVRRFGFRKMQQEVEQLKHLNKQWQEFCIGRPSSKTNGSVTSTSRSSNSAFRGLFKTFNDQVEDLTLRRSQISNSTCHYMAKSEIAFTNQLKMSQMMKAMRQLGNKAIRLDPRSMTGGALTYGAIAWLNHMSEEIGFVPLNTTKHSG